MSWGDALEQVNYLNALWATLAALVVGYIWYGEKVFAQSWQKLVGLKKKDLEDSNAMVTLMLLMGVVYFAASVLIGSLLALSGMSGGGDGALMGLLVGTFAGGLPLLSSNSFARRKLELSLIDGGYVVLSFTLIGYILGAF